MKIKKIIFYVLICAAIFFSSCITFDDSKEYTPLDYSEENVVQEEIKRIVQIKENDVLKSLWKCILLKENVSGNNQVQYSEEILLNVNSLYDEIIESVKINFAKSVEDKNFINAATIFNSINAAGLNAQKLLNCSYSDISKNIAGVKLNDASPFTKISECINGTVTVLVDKGIRIEKGMGYSDMVLGSGFFISKDGYVITNHHVISDCVDTKYTGIARVYIKLAQDPDTRIPARVVGWDSVLDLALLKCEVDAPYVFALGSSDDLDVGEKIFTIGSPLGLERTLTSGIISSKDRELFTIGHVFQIDAAVNSGNSGGPMIDSEGRVQAVVFAGVANYQGLNFAIPVEYLVSDLPFLFNGGERLHSWTGCYGKTERLPGASSANEGVLVQYVMPGSSAYFAGIEEDDVIVQINDTKIYTLDDLNKCYLQSNAGEIVKIFVKKSGEIFEKICYLEKRPENPGYEVYLHDRINSALLPLCGIKLERCSSSDRRQYMVTKVLKNSVADEYGFSVDDPVTLLRYTLSQDNSALYVEMYVKRRSSGFLDVGMGLMCSMDSPYYF